MLRVTLADARGPPAWVLFAFGIFDARLQKPNRGIGAHCGDGITAEGSRGNAGVVIEEEDPVTLNNVDTAIAPGRYTKVVGQIKASHTIREPCGFPPVADHDDVEVNALLRAE